MLIEGSRDSRPSAMVGIGHEVDLRSAGEDGLLVEVHEEAVQALTDWLMYGDWKPWIEDIVPSHRTVLVMTTGRQDEIAAAIRTGAWQERPRRRPPTRTLRIPITYGGPDFDEVCQQTGLSGEELIRLHSGVDQVVSHFGFSPGFPYLAGLPDRLHVPRRATPRQSIPKGSVAIAAGLTVIYPGGTPGGWNLIGRADAPPFWDLNKEPPNLLSLGDRIKFVRNHD